MRTKSNPPVVVSSEGKGNKQEDLLSEREKSEETSEQIALIDILRSDGCRTEYSCLHVDSSFLKKYAQDFLLTFGPGITGTVHNRCFGKPC